MADEETRVGTSQQAARVAWLLARGATLTVAEAEELTGYSNLGAYGLLERLRDDPVLNIIRVPADGKYPGADSHLPWPPIYMAADAGDE